MGVIKDRGASIQKRAMDVSRQCGVFIYTTSDEKMQQQVLLDLWGSSKDRGAGI